MLRGLYAVYDSVAGEMFGPIFSVPNDGVAIRTFRDSLLHRDATHREDYSLYRLGGVDTETGQLYSDGVAVFDTASALVITGAAIVAAATTIDSEQASNVTSIREVPRG